MATATRTGEPCLCCSFVTGLRAGQDAVANSHSLRWSSGAVDGHVNRIILWNQLVKSMPGTGDEGLPGATGSPSTPPTRPVRDSSWEG